MSSVTPTSLEQWLSQIEACHPSEIELGLERIATVAQSLGIDASQAEVITVAGTNGKGSCVTAMEAVLLAAGRSVGAFTSPHIRRYNERIRLNGSEAEDDQLVAAFEAIDQARGDVSLTYFEYNTLAALWLFQQYSLDIWLLEVGLGGRLDAVNMIDADIAVITSIALDHCDWLGDDLAQIGREKAGICRATKPAILATTELHPAVLEQVQSIGAKPVRASEHFEAGRDEQGHFFWRSIEGLPPLSLSHIECHLPEPSLAAAVAALMSLKSPPVEQDFQALQQLELSGRLEQRGYRDRQVLLDVAHNPAAAERLAATLADRREREGGRTVALFSVMADKSIDEMIDTLAPVVDAWMLAPLEDCPRALAVHDLADKLGARGIAMISVSKNMRQALARATQLAGEGDRILVTGSFFTVAEVSALMDRDDERAKSRAKAP